MAKKSLGQHWLNDKAALDSIVEAAELSEKDTVLEIGPGLGSLTRKLLKRAGKVVAVELDHELVERLGSEIQADNFEIIEGDILGFDYSKMPSGFKVVANIPYYLTGKLLRLLTNLKSRPAIIVLLVQKEVAERIVAKPGRMNLLAISAQINFEPRLGRLVPAELFSPPPKVDSQVVTLRLRPKPLFNVDDRQLFRLVKAGFSEKRKKLRSSLSGGLELEKDRVDSFLTEAGISNDARAQELSLAQWHQLYKVIPKI